MHVSPAERLVLGVLAGGHLDERCATEKDRRLTVDQHSVIAQARHVRAARGRGAEDQRDRRDAQGRELGQVAEYPAARNEQFRLRREVRSAGLDQIDHGEPVALGDLQRPQVLAQRVRVDRAATHGRIVRDDHAFDIGDHADPGDDARADGELGAPCGQAGQFEKWRIPVQQQLDAFPREQSTTSVVPIRVLRTAAGDRERQLRHRVRTASSSWAARLPTQASLVRSTEDRRTEVMCWTFHAARPSGNVNGHSLSPTGFRVKRASIWYHRSMRLLTRWLVLHGLVRLATRRWAAAGDPQAALIADPTVRANPIPAYERHPGAGAACPHPNRLHHGGLRDRTRGTALRRLQRYLDHDQRAAVDSLGGTGDARCRYAPAGRAVIAVHRAARPHAVSRSRVLRVHRAGCRQAERSGGDARPTLCSTRSPPLRRRRRRPTSSTRTARNCPWRSSAICSVCRPADRRLVLELGELAAPSLDVGLPYRGFRDTEMGLRRFHVWLGGHLAELRRNPGDDLISQLIQASLDGRPLTDRELRATAGLVLVAGFETTVNLLGNGVRLLLDHPDQLDVLEANPTQWPNAVDEILRLESPVQLTARVCRRDTELAGQPIRAGQPVTIDPCRREP